MSIHVKAYKKSDQRRPSAKRKVVDMVMQFRYGEIDVETVDGYVNEDSSWNPKWHRLKLSGHGVPYISQRVRCNIS